MYVLTPLVKAHTSLMTAHVVHGCFGSVMTMEGVFVFL